MYTIEIPSDALVILVAPSGAGKSTFVRRHFSETEIVSSDRCRALVSDDEAEQRATGPAFEVFDAILRGRLRLGRLTAADATNLEPVPRERMRDLAREHGRPVVAIVLDVPIDVARARNLARPRTVPDRVLEMHYERFRVAREVLPGEGYDAVHEIPAGADVEIVRSALEPAAPGGGRDGRGREAPSTGQPDDGLRGGVHDGYTGPAPGDAPLG